MLFGMKRRGCATASLWASLASAAIFALVGLLGPWLYLRFILAGADNPDMAAALGMVLMPDLRLPGLVAAFAMLLVALAYWRARRWVDLQSRWD